MNGGLGRGGAARLFPSTQSPDHHNGRRFCWVPGEGCCRTLRCLWPPPLPAWLCLPRRRGGAARLVPVAGQSGHELGLGLQLPPAGRKSERGSRSRGTVGMPTGSAGLLERPGRGELVKLGELAPVVGAPGVKVLSRSPRPGGEEFEPLRPTPALTLGILGRPHCRALLLSPCTRAGNLWMPGPAMPLCLLLGSSSSCPTPPPPGSLPDLCSLPGSPGS